VNDRQLGDRLRRALEAERPPGVSAAEILRRAEAMQSEGHHADIPDREFTRPRLRRPAQMPTGKQRAPGAVTLGRDETQRRELEETRRSRTGSLFEPARPAKPAVVAPPARRRAPSWAVPAVIVLALMCLLVGGGLGYLLPRPASASSPPAASSRPGASTLIRTVPESKGIVPPACLQTAQRADELIDLFTRHVRDRRLSSALKAYTLASQACRKEASP
jgi:hypothetical protein